MSAPNVRDITCTVLTAPTPCTKRIALRVDGGLDKTSRGITRATADKVVCADIYAFAERLQQLTNRNALMLGVNAAARTVIVPEQHVTADLHARGVRSRTRKHFAYPPGAALMMLDYDPEPGKPPLEREALLDTLFELLPEARGCAHVWWPSAGSHIVDESNGREVIGCAGQRVYLAVTCGSNIPRIGKILEQRVWLAGLGRYDVSRAGSLLQRGIFDNSVWQPERIDYIGGADCIPPLVQRRPALLVADGPAFDAATLGDLDDVAKARVKRLQKAARTALEPQAAETRAAWVETHAGPLATKRGITHEAAKALLARACQDSRLEPDFVILMNDGSEVTVGEIVVDRARYHGCRCRDPLEPDYRDDPRIGYIDLTPGQPPVIHSHAHGGVRYSLQGAVGFGLVSRRDPNKLIATSAAAPILEPIIRAQGLAYDGVSLSWMRYDPASHIWRRVSKDDAWKTVWAAIVSDGGGASFNKRFVDDVYHFLRVALKTPDGLFGGVKDNRLPMANGVLCLDGMSLEPHAAENYLTWTLPFDYDPKAHCDPVISWLRGAVGDDIKLEIARAVINAVIKGRADLQKYVELIGAAGSGKGTFTRLLCALVGNTNVYSTSLEALSKNRFETAAIYGKRLVLITEAEKWVGSVNTLKAITGQDLLRYEEKHNQQGHGSFVFDGMVLMSANEALQTADLTDGIARRRLHLRFDQIVTPEQRRDLDTEFEPYLPGVLNWALALPDREVDRLLLRTLEVCSQARIEALENLIATNPIAEWADTHLIIDAAGAEFIGAPPPAHQRVNDVGDVFAYNDVGLYGSFRAFNDTQGGRVEYRANRYSALLKNLLVNQLGHVSVRAVHTRCGSRLHGVRVRHVEDSTIPTLITGRAMDR